MVKRAVFCVCCLVSWQVINVGFTRAPAMPPLPLRASRRSPCRPRFGGSFTVGALRTTMSPSSTCLVP
eukprot:5370001-Prymnesium_polylepis.1